MNYFWSCIFFRICFKEYAVTYLIRMLGLECDKWAQSKIVRMKMGDIQAWWILILCVASSIVWCQRAICKESNNCTRYIANETGGKIMVFVKLQELIGVEEGCNVVNLYSFNWQRITMLQVSYRLGGQNGGCLTSWDHLDKSIVLLKLIVNLSF